MRANILTPGQERGIYPAGRPNALHASGCSETHHDRAFCSINAALLRCGSVNAAVQCYCSNALRIARMDFTNVASALRSVGVIV